MYNDKNRQPFTRAPMKNGGMVGVPRAQARDLPDEDRLGAGAPRLDPSQPRLDLTQPRRRCDGTLRGTGELDSLPNSPRGIFGDPRNSADRPCPSPCATGRCGGWGLEDRPLAMVYSPCQAWRDAYPPEVALSRGTLFSELDLPFDGGKTRRGCM